MLAVRTATAVVGIPILLALVYLGGPVFWIATAIAAAQAAREAIGLLVPKASKVSSTTIVVCAISLVGAAAIGPAALVAMIGLSMVLLLAEGLLLQPPDQSRSSSPAGITAVVYAGLPLAILVLLRQSGETSIPVATPFATVLVPVGAAWVFAVFSVTWAVDTIAYLAGRAFGKHPFSPRLSPKKTWEGTIAGATAGTLAFAAWSPSFGWSLPLAMIGGFVLAIACITGDLVESALKRSAGVKDAGSILPGHGGLLDRIDSLAFSVVVVFLLRALDQSVQVLGR